MMSLLSWYAKGYIIFFNIAMSLFIIGKFSELYYTENCQICIYFGFKFHELTHDNIPKI